LVCRNADKLDIREDGFELRFGDGTATEERKIRKFKVERLGSTDDRTVRRAGRVFRDNGGAVTCPNEQCVADKRARATA